MTNPLMECVLDGLWWVKKGKEVQRWIKCGVIGDVVGGALDGICWWYGAVDEAGVVDIDSAEVFV